MTHSKLDAYNQERMRNVFPSDWKNPKGKEVYDLVVIGGGPGGMTAAIVAANLRVHVAIIEKEHFGGECFNVGCIPSKAFLRSSRCAAQVRDAAEFGVEIPKGWRVNFLAVMERVRKLQSIQSPHDSAEHLKSLGIDVFLGTAHFADANTIEVGDRKLRFKKAIVATGTYPIIPEISGLEEAGYLTNQTVFDLTSLPSRLAVIGAGPIGCELSQAFLRFGSEVTLITRGASLLPRDDVLAAERLQQVLSKEGMKLLFNTQIERIEKKGKEKVLYLPSGKSLVVDDILIAIGRAPNVEGLGLEKAGIGFNLKEGIVASDTLQTSNRNVYVVGDVGSRYKFTHIAVELAKIAVQNTLNGGNEKVSQLIVPWSTFTEPEIAHIGLQEQEAKKLGIQVTTSVTELAETERAILDGETAGFVKIYTRSGTDQILGSTIMASHAGDMISEIAVAMAGQSIAKAIHPFPTQAEAIRKSANELEKALVKETKLSGRKIA
jgi:pyruvate/2-oxoglutarate dehydrogenase complex dihydrolipoamide dehydrogenase (E3) component